MPDDSPHLVDLDRLCLRRLCQLGLKPDHFFDVGASTGRWSVQVAKDFPEARFDLFEPLADHVPGYREKLEAALLQHPCFLLHKVALGPESKSTLMYIPDHPVGSTALNLGPNVAKGWERWEVDMLTLDQLVLGRGMPTPQVIKIDTQGCELGILQGARQILPQVSVLFLECWLARAYGQQTPLYLEIANWLRDFGFHLWDLGGCWRDAENVLISQDCVFLNARSKLSRLHCEHCRLAAGVQNDVAGPSSAQKPLSHRPDQHNAGQHCNGSMILPTTGLHRLWNKLWKGRSNN
ncbi:MAG TPA: FkbM family methyltransferase [Clostridia bacterium]|nr:FkbM family methyltransferase [Clostridia bacterium]